MQKKKKKKRREKKNNDKTKKRKKKKSRIFFGQSTEKYIRACVTSKKRKLSTTRLLRYNET